MDHDRAPDHAPDHAPDRAPDHAPDHAPDRAHAPDQAQTHEQTHGPGQHDHQGDGALAELLDLDALVFARPLRAVHAEVAALAEGPVRRVLDLGAGTGAGTVALLQQHVDAHVVAVDASAEMLAHLRDRVEQLGLADRVTTRCVDLDDAPDDLGPADLAWASASLHHLADPDSTLAQVTAAIRPGGLLAVVELTGFPAFVPAGTPGGVAEAAARDLLSADRAVDLPAMGSDWSARLARAGLVVEAERVIVLEPATSVADGGGGTLGDYAAATLARVREAVADRLDAADLASLDALLDGGPQDVRRRGDLHVRGERQLVVARRPA